GGFGIFFFPLSGAAFPGTRYAGPYGGGSLNFPLGTEAVSLQVGGQFWPSITTSGKLKLLGTAGKASGFLAEGGLRIFFSPFEILLLGRFERFDSTYTGTTNAKLSPTQYNNV